MCLHFAAMRRLPLNASGMLLLLTLILALSFNHPDALGKSAGRSRLGALPDGKGSNGRLPLAPRFKPVFTVSLMRSHAR